MNIIELARKAGFEVHDRKQQARVGMDALIGIDSTQNLERFAALVRAQALEEAAMLCDVMEDGHYPDGHLCAGVAWECAAAIRALKEKT